MTDRLELPIEGAAISLQGGVRQYSFSCSSFSSQAQETPVVVPSTLTLSEAEAHFHDSESDYLVVQDSEDVIEGVLSRQRLFELLRQHATSAHRLQISRFIERNICMEPEFATLREVIERLEVADARCALIYDRLGRPMLVATLERLLHFADR